MNTLLFHKEVETKCEDQALVKELGLIGLLDEYGDEVCGYPILPQKMFADLATVFPTAYVRGYTGQALSRLSMDLRVEFYGPYNPFASSEWPKRWEEYAFAKIPTEILRLMRDVIRENTFPTLEIRTPEYKKARPLPMLDPFLLGIVPDGRRALIAQWGEADLLFFPEIEEVAKLRRRVYGPFHDTSISDWIHDIRDARRAREEIERLSRENPKLAPFLVPPIEE